MSRLIHVFRAGACAVLVVGGLGLMSGQASAQSATPGANAESLAARLDGLREELAAERAALAAAREHGASERQRLEARRGELAARLMQLQARTDDLDARMAGVQRRAEATIQSTESDTAAWNALRDRARLTAEGLALALAELPATQVDTEALRADAARLADADSPGTRDAVLRVLGALDAAHGEATASRVRDTLLFTAPGDRRHAAVLAVGHVGFAYETDNGRIGVAVKAPDAATGFRWREALAIEEQDAVRDAIAAVRNGQAAAFAMPMDLAGRMGSMKPPESFGERLRAGGAVMFPLLAVALFALLLAAERFWWLYLRNRTRGASLGAALADAAQGRFDEAEQRLGSPRSAGERILLAALRRRDAGRQAVEDAAQEQMLREWPRLERGMGGLALLAAVAPLLGLLGTVTGIIHTFGVIRSLGNANPELMAGGISEALITTAAGLCVAIPVLLAHSVLRGRAEHVMAQAEGQAATLIARLARHAGHREGAA